jgi:hypothetical protein
MRALPTELWSTEGLQVTGLSRPDCHGVLQLAVGEPESMFLQFVCRIGHALSLSQVTAAKEAAIALREGEVACAEMIQLLDDLGRQDVPATMGVEARAERRARLQRHLGPVRTIIEQDRRLDPGTGARYACDPATEPAEPRRGAQWP